MTAAVPMSQFLAGISKTAGLRSPVSRAYDDGYQQGRSDQAAEFDLERAERDSVFATATAAAILDQAAQRRAVISAISPVLCAACTALIPVVARAALLPWLEQALDEELTTHSDRAITIWHNGQLTDALTPIAKALPNARMEVDDSIPLLRIDWQSEEEARCIDLDHIQRRIIEQLEALTTFIPAANKEAPDA